MVPNIHVYHKTATKRNHREIPPVNCLKRKMILPRFSLSKILRKNHKTNSVRFSENHFLPLGLPTVTLVQSRDPYIKTSQSKSSKNIEQLASTLPSYLEKLEYLADLYNFDLLFNAEGGLKHLRLVYPKSAIAKPLFVESFRATTKEECCQQALNSKRPELVLTNDKNANKRKNQKMPKKSKNGQNVDDLTREFEIDLN